MNVVIKRNIELNGLEIYFPKMPLADIRSELKNRNWRYNGYKKCWYNYYSEKHNDELMQLCFGFKLIFRYENGREEQLSEKEIDRRNFFGEAECIPLGEYRMISPKDVRFKRVRTMY